MSSHCFSPMIVVGFYLWLLVSLMPVKGRFVNGIFTTLVSFVGFSVLKIILVSAGLFVV